MKPSLTWIAVGALCATAVFIASCQLGAACDPACPEGYVCRTDTLRCVPDTPDAGVDAGRSDAGRQDAGQPRDAGSDAGSADAGTADAGTQDAGVADAGESTDAGELDSGVDQDAGVDPDAGWSLVFRDEFTRSLTGSWGSNGAVSWTVDPTHAVDFSVDG